MSELGYIRSRSFDGKPVRWSIPKTVRDLPSLNEWLASLPVGQRDTDESDFAGETPLTFQAFGWGQAVTREQIDDYGFEKAREASQGYVFQSLGLVLLGFFCASPEGIVWRVRPEFRWEDDPITGNAMAIVYARVGRDYSKKAPSEEEAA